MAWFRRGKAAEARGSEGDATTPAPDAAPVDAPDAVEDSTGATGGDGGTAVSTDPQRGPWDVTAAPGREGHLTLGSLWVPAFEGLMLSFEMDQTQSQVTAVQVMLGDSALQLQAFAAPKSSGLWNDIRTEIAEGLTAQGRSATEEEGDFGTELVLDAGAQGSMRFLGVDGPRWFLRGVISGRAATDAEAATGLREVFSHVVVDRGHEPMGPRELLPLSLPDEGAQARPADVPGRSASDLDPFTRGPEITEIR